MNVFFTVRAAKRTVFLFVFLLLCSCNRNKLTICFTGDILLDRGIRKEIERSGISSVFDDTRTLFRSSDAVIINLECPVTDIERPVNKKYIFRGEPEWLPALRRYGITHAAMANNHIMDQGRDGITDTYNNLISSNITPVGYGDNQCEACRPCIIEKNGITVAIFNSLLLPVENWVCLEHEKGICQATVEQLRNDINTFKSIHPDSRVVVFLHWGVEFQKHPTLLQRKNAYMLIDAGADAIIGHHPHVIQDEEIYRGKTIFYSLGNFIFDQKGEDRSTGLAVYLTFDNAGIAVKKTVFRRGI
jgi:poly-gamma-glutamate synthesis protein (capsule biosynthesis protein)